MDLTIKNVSKETAEILTIIAVKSGGKIVNTINSKTKASVLSETKEIKDPRFKQLDEHCDKIIKKIRKRIIDEKISAW